MLFLLKVFAKKLAQNYQKHAATHREVQEPTSLSKLDEQDEKWPLTCCVSKSWLSTKLTATEDPAIGSCSPIQRWENGQLADISGNV